MRIGQGRHSEQRHVFRAPHAEAKQFEGARHHGLVDVFELFKRSVRRLCVWIVMKKKEEEGRRCIVNTKENTSLQEKILTFSQPQ